MVEEDNEEAGDQEYTVPPLAFNWVELFLQMVASIPAFAGGALTTLITMASVFVHPQISVPITVYVVVIVGDAVTEDPVDELKPKEGDQE